jgi:hypothetical protein
MASVREVDIHELKALDPKRFEKEHQGFLDNGPYHEWWDTVEDDFKQQMDELGVQVADIQFEGIDYGHADAAWQGSFPLAPFMKRTKVRGSDDTLAERYPALYLAIEHDRSWARVYLDGWRNTTLSVDVRENTRFIDPLGIFSELDQETWEELLDDQWSDCGIEEVAREFAQEKADDLLEALRSEWDYISSEEYFIESCEINEVKFELEVEDEIHG